MAHHEWIEGQKVWLDLRTFDRYGEEYAGEIFSLVDVDDTYWVTTKLGHFHVHKTLITLRGELLNPVKEDKKITDYHADQLILMINNIEPEQEAGKIFHKSEFMLKHINKIANAISHEFPKRPILITDAPNEFSLRVKAETDVNIVKIRTETMLY